MENNETTYREFLEAFSTPLQFGPASDVQTAMGEFDIGHLVSQLYTLPVSEQIARRTDDTLACSGWGQYYVPDGPDHAPVPEAARGFLSNRREARHRMEEGDNAGAARSAALALKNYANCWHPSENSPLVAAATPDYNRCILLHAVHHCGVN
jgi:hypothetical protein